VSIKLSFSYFVAGLGRCACNLKKSLDSDNFRIDKKVINFDIKALEALALAD
jgi:hypothetical protein